jgi:DNA polymerase III alpha subunit
MRQADVNFVTELNEMVAEYNRNVAASQELRVKESCGELSFDWTIPDKYKTLDVVDYLFQAHQMLFEHVSPTEFDQREKRLAEEVVLYQKLGLFDVLRAIIWIINTLTATNTVWGIGRGSSVSSYALFVVGVHDVDSYAYDLDIDDFLHE